MQWLLENRNPDDFSVDIWIADDGYRSTTVPCPHLTTLNRPCQHVEITGRTSPVSLAEDKDLQDKNPWLINHPEIQLPRFCITVPIKGKLNAVLRVFWDESDACLQSRLQNGERLSVVELCIFSFELAKGGYVWEGNGRSVGIGRRSVSQNRLR